MSGAGFSTDDLQEALKQTAQLMSVPLRSPRWVKPTWWDHPLTVTRTRPIPAASGWLDLISITLGKSTFAPDGYSLRLAGYVATGKNDPLTTGMTYRFIKNGSLLNAQEFDITNTIERHVLRYSGVAAPWPAFGRKMFLNVGNNGTLKLQVNNPSGASETAVAALYGYYYPNLGDLPGGSLEQSTTESYRDA